MASSCASWRFWPVSSPLPLLLPKSWVERCTTHGNIREKDLSCHNGTIHTSKASSRHRKNSDALWILRRPQDALYVLDQTITLNPKGTDAWYNKGMFLGALGQYQEALFTF